MASLSPYRTAFAFLVCVGLATATSGALAGSHSEDSSSADSSPDSDAKDSDAKDSDAKDSDAKDSEEVATNVPEKKTASAKGESLGHAGQFHVRLGLGGGYRIVMRYDNSAPCSTVLNDDGTQKTFCGFGSPLNLDAAVGYGVSDGIEPFLWGRFGLTHESETTTAPLVIVGGGLRFYAMSDSLFKFFVEPAVGLELEKGHTDAANRAYPYKTDFILRLSVGPQIDFARNVGVYASAGLTAGMVRSLQTWMDVHGGIQARFP